MKRLLAVLLAASCAGPKQQAREQGAPPAQQSAAAAAQQSATPQAAPAPAPPVAKPAAPQSQKAADTGVSSATQVPAPSPVPEPQLTPDQPFRAERPAPLAVQPHFDAPVPVQRRLKNGARVLIVENHSVPLVSIEVRFLHGVDADPPDRPGLAEFVADTVDEGTRTRTATKLAEEVENLAAHLFAGAGLDVTNVRLNCLTETLPQALELLADVVQNPAFRPEDVERVRVLRLTGLEQKKASIGALAADEASRVLFGPDHPWGKPSGGTPESARAITREELAKFHDTWWVPNDAVISVAGDVTPAGIVALLEKQFASWKARPLPKLQLPPIPRDSKRRVDALEKANATQSQVWVVGHLFRARDPDAVPLRVANLTLGGLFTSRLNMNLREAHGYSYGVSSRLSLGRTGGTFSASGGIIAKNTVEAVAEYEKELTKFSSGVLTDAELAAAKESLIRSLPSALETNDAISGAMANAFALGLPLDYYKTLPAKIGKVGQPEIRRVVRKWIRPQRWPIVVVGPVGQSGAALEKLGLGPVTVSPAPGTQPSAQPAGSK